MTPLQLAAARGDYSVVKLLLDTGAEVDGKSKSLSENRHWTALTYSCLGGHHRVSKLLLERGAHPEGGALPGPGLDDEVLPTGLATNEIFFCFIFFKKNLKFAPGANQ